MREIAKNLTVFTAGGLAYGLVEIAWRSSTHISMFFVGGDMLLADREHRRARQRSLAHISVGAVLPDRHLGGVHVWSVYKHSLGAWRVGLLRPPLQRLGAGMPAVLGVMAFAVRPRDIF